MFCPICNEKHNGIMKMKEETYPVKGEDITIAAKVMYCECCGNEVWDEAFDSQNLLQAFANYRERHNLIQPQEIQKIRERYGLSQTAFACVLGLGDKTITRYENGSIPDAAQNNLIELMNNPENFEKLLLKNRTQISEQDYRKASERLASLHPKIIYCSKGKYRYAKDTGSIMETSTMYWGKPKHA